MVDEGYERYGVTAEIASVIADGAFYYLDAPVKRMGAMDVPVPFSPVLEDLTVPTEKTRLRRRPGPLQGRLMPARVIMPALELAQDSGKVLQWLRAPGDTVRKGDPLLEIETDKATVEIEAPASGVLREVTAQAGDVIPVGQTIALIFGADEAARSAAAAPPRRRAAPPAALPLPPAVAPAAAAAAGRGSPRSRGRSPSSTASTSPR